MSGTTGFLEYTVAAKADVLVTGDTRRVQRLKTFRGIRIVSPRPCLDALTGGV